ncbi:hypothetical protein LR004_03165, partial [Candidatus Gracilibacteria bacterium]|nr:hypothetical protein [Candidatus Gracilibacteria bacterium]
ILSKAGLSSTKEDLLSDLLLLINEKLFELYNNEVFQESNQILLERNILTNLKNKLNSFNKTSLYSYISSNKNVDIIHVSNDDEFIEGGKIKKISYANYFSVNSSNYSFFLKKKGKFLFLENGEIHFVEESQQYNKIPYSQSANYVKNIIGPKKMYLNDGGKYYSYNFSNYIYFGDRYGFYIKDLEKKGDKLSNILLYIGDDKSYKFITDYTKVDLISSSIIYGVTDKQKFLHHLVNDKLHLGGNTDSDFIKLKNEVKKLTHQKTDEEKIKILYSWVLDSLKYTQEINIDDKKIFSGILSYTNSDGICEGYVKLLSYALMYSGVSETEVIRGDVVDAQDFPKIGHAWMRIGDKYYDPTFDDPIGNTKTKTLAEYKYFGLPRDLLYANRFDYGTTPELLKTKSLEYRINFVNQRLSLLEDKYKTMNYLLLESAHFNKKNGLKVGEKIDINSAKKILEYGEVTEENNGELKINIDGSIKNITKLQYYVVDDTSVGQLIEHKNYNTTGLYLFKWNKLDGTSEYRVGFDVVIK